MHDCILDLLYVVCSTYFFTAVLISTGAGDSVALHSDRSDNIIRRIAVEIPIEGYTGRLA